MQATRFEYRFRFMIHALIYILGFTAPWLFLHSLAGVPGFTTSSTWLVLSTALTKQGWLAFDAATITLLIIALLLTGLGAWLRVWGSAYVGSSIVKSPSMHGETMLADGPYRRTRNPLYLGTLLHTLGVTVLMPPSGAVFAVVLLWIFQVRLALAEEPFLAAKFGQAYLDYEKAVLGEIYFLAVFLVLAVFGWSFNAQPLRQGLIISVGLALVVRAFLPRAAQDAPAVA
jgi:protein-S-isoprenylcysteine O-methyltransferase Ste14